MATTVTVQQPQMMQQVAVAPHSVPAPPQEDVRNFPRSGTGTKIFGFALAQLILGLVAIIFEAAAIGEGTAGLGAWINYRERNSYAYSRSIYYSYYHGTTPGFSGAGIWAGAWTILAASFGIAAGKSSKNKCLIVTHMVLSIMTTIFVWGIIINTSIVIGAINECFAVGSGACADPRWNAVRALEVIVLLTGIIIFVFSIVSASYCCKAVCCCGGGIINRGYGLYAPTTQYVIAQPAPVQQPGMVVYSGTTTTAQPGVVPYSGYNPQMPYTAVGAPGQAPAYPAQGAPVQAPGNPPQGAQGYPAAPTYPAQVHLQSAPAPQPGHPGVYSQAQQEIPSEKPPQYSVQ